MDISKFQNEAMYLLQIRNSVNKQLVDYLGQDLNKVFEVSKIIKFEEAVKHDVPVPVKPEYLEYPDVYISIQITNSSMSR
jgi:hypothetical protein